MPKFSLAHASYLDPDSQRQIHGFLAHLQEPACQVALTAQLSVETSKGFDAANPHSIPKLVNKLTVAATTKGLHEAAPILAMLAVLHQEFRDENKDNPFFTIPDEFVPTKETIDVCMARYRDFITELVNEGQLPS